MPRRISAPVQSVSVQVFTVPTDKPEADGTLQWNSTTLVLCQIKAAGVQGIGYSYADEATAHLINNTLAQEIVGFDAMNVSAAWNVMVRRIRNLGRPGICSMAISAVDNALWDLKARLLTLPLAKLLGQVREAVPIYGSAKAMKLSPDLVRCFPPPPAAITTYCLPLTL